MLLLLLLSSRLPRLYLRLFLFAAGTMLVLLLFLVLLSSCSPVISSSVMSSSSFTLVAAVVVGVAALAFCAAAVGAAVGADVAVMTSVSESEIVVVSPLLRFVLLRFFVRLQAFFLSAVRLVDIAVSPFSHRILDIFASCFRLESSSSFSCRASWPHFVSCSLSLTTLTTHFALSLTHTHILHTM